MKSSYQTALKVISIVTIIIAVFSLITSILLLTVTPMMTSDPEFVNEYGEAMMAQGVTDMNATEGAITFGLIVLFLGAASFVVGVFTLIVGILGLRGAKDPSKIRPFRVFAIIGLILSIIGCIFSLFTIFGSPGMTAGSIASTLASSIFDLVLTAVCVWLAQKISAQTSLGSY